MHTYTNSSIIYVSPSHGDDSAFNGLSPTNDKNGNGPFKTLEKALTSIGQRRITGFMRPMTISITDDIYLENTISLSLDKANMCRYTSGSAITIESFGNRKKIIGGIKIDGWKHDVFNGQQCISATIPKKSNEKFWNLTDLFVNGKRANNTRFPAEGTLKCLETENDISNGELSLFRSSKWFIAKKEDLEKIDGIENATVNFYHHWIDEHTPIESYDKESGKLVMKYPSRFMISTIYEPEEDTSALNYYLENIPSMFLKKNDWYFDTKSEKVYYIPNESNISLENIVAYAPTLNKLFDFCGNPHEKITDIRLSNLDLLYTNGNYVSKYEKTLVTKDGVETYKYKYVDDENSGYASDIQSACWAHAAIGFKYAKRCSVENCLIHHTGAYGVEIKSGCSGIRIENNEFSDMGAGGVRVFGGEFGCEDFDITNHCTVRNNKITNCGKKIAAGCGIILCHASENEISENEICYTDYTGISVGWVWGYGESSSFGNIIRSNHIHHIGMGRLSDMGGIYLLGKQTGTVVSYNRIHDVNSAHYGGWGIYTDEGSSYIIIENNVVYNTKCESFHQHYGSYNVVRNNIFAFGGSCLRTSQPEMHDGVCFENNIFVTNGVPIYGECTRLTCLNSKNNLIWDISADAPILQTDMFGEKWNLERLNNNYLELGSVIANPEFLNIQEYDFTVSPKSPAIKLGFKRITGFTASGKE